MADKSLKLVIIIGFIILVTLLLLSEFIVSNSYKRISAADLVLWRISNVIHHLIAYAQPEEEDEGNIAVLDNGVDKFGIDKLYPTKTGGEGGGGEEEEWYMNMLNPLDDERIELMNTILNKTLYPFYTLTKNTNDDGSWKIISTTPETKVRMHVFTSTGYNQSKIATYDHTDLADKGYMQSPNDWKDINV
jgi:hypothetical protein